ncbi:MAG: glycosyltransferase [Lachnospiraceae bacterium]|nr:glycosyltransferase [Lachnospiraceae bacterium]
MGKHKIKKISFSKSLAMITVIGLLLYIGWRLIFTVPDHEKYGWVASIAGICLLIAETISVIEALIQCWQLSRQYEPPMPVIPEEWYPDVDVMIATHNEEEDLLFKTVNACTRMKYPDKSKVHIHICDDTNRPEIKMLAQKFGVNYFGLSDNKLAKAGNLNNAIAKTSAPLIVTFDADMIPNSEFLLETVPYFFLPKMKQDENGDWIPKKEFEIDEDEKIGFIQTPQTFYNPDLFQYNLYSEKQIPNEQDYFFRQVNIGRNRSNAPIYAGSNTVISREALELVGGIRTGTITEDFETGLMIQAEGYKCYAVDKLLAKGMAPITIKSLIKQRERWGRGCIYSLRRVHILLNPKFDFKLKWAYFSCRLYWGSFTRRLIYIMAPIFFAVFSIPVVTTGLGGVLCVWLPSYILYAITLKKISGDIRNTRWSNIIDTAIFPYMLLPLWAESLFIRKKDFHVTNKSRVQSESGVYLALPHIVLFVLSVISIIVMIKDLIMYSAFGSIVVIYWLLINSSSLLMSIFFMLGRKSERMTERFQVSLPIEVRNGENVYDGTMVDISENGLAFILDSAVYFPYNEEDRIECSIKYNEYFATVLGKIVTVKKESNRGYWKYCLSVNEMDEETKKEYFQIIYDRVHTLPKKLSLNSSYFGDIAKNVARRTETGEASRRHTARIVVNEKFETESGQTVIVENFNFEFVRLSALEGEELPDRLTLFSGTDYEMKCEVHYKETRIFAINNWKELVENIEFLKIVDKWNRGSRRNRTRGEK